MQTPLRALLWPGLAAAALHLLLGWQWLAHRDAAAPGTRTILAMSLVQLAEPEPEPAAPDASPQSPPEPDPAAPETLPAIRPEPESNPPESATPPQAPSASEVAGPRVSAEAEHFFHAGELTRLPGLPGEPVIDLGEGSDLLDGSIALRLFIDEKGRVVQHRVESREGLPDAIVDKLVTVFAGYPYIAGERQGLAVKCQVVLAIAVREGQAAMGGPR